MRDLIDRQAAIEELKSYIVDPDTAISENPDDVFQYNAGIRTAVGVIMELQTASPWHRVEDELPEPNIQCLVRDDDNNCAVGYYRQDARAWDSPFFGWVERDDEYYEDGDLCRIGKVVAWMPIEPPKEESNA